MAEGGASLTQLMRRFHVGAKQMNRWIAEHGIALRSQFVSLPDEEWRAIVGWEGFYEVSNMGRVRSLDRMAGNRRIHGRVMKPYKDRPKYPHMIIQLSKGGRSKEGAAFPLVHKLVLEAFVGPRPAGLEACHNNGDGTDNRLTNLRWDTHKANMADQFEHGTNTPRKPKPRKWKPGSRGRVPRWYIEQQST